MINHIKTQAGSWGVLITVITVLFSGCSSRARLPEKGSKEYVEAVSTFYVGLAALQVGDDVHAASKLSQLTQLIPGEPAAWVNWAILAIRQRNFDEAAQRLEQARKLAPENDQIYYLLGILEGARGGAQEAARDLRKAVEINPKHLRAAYQLAQQIEQQGGENSAAEFQHVMQGILNAQPENLAALLELGRMAAKAGDSATLKSVVAKISSRSSAWPPEVQQQVAALQAAASGPDAHAAGMRMTFLRNVLLRVPEYREDLAVIKPPPGEEAEPLTHFLRMESPSFTPAPPDTAITFQPEPVADAGNGWTLVRAVLLNPAGNPAVIEANSHAVRLSAQTSLAFPGGSSKQPPLPEGILAIDFNYDFKPDLIFAGAGGVRFWRQENPEKFTDVTALAKLPKNVTEGMYNGAWAVDIEADGDLDVVLGARNGVPTVLRNNGDGTFTAIHPFSGVSGLIGFAWADLDGDGNPDATIIDGSGRLHVFINQRSGQFRERSLPSNLPLIKAVTAADVNNDGVLDLVLVGADGAVIRISDKNSGQDWDKAEIGQVPNAASYLAGEVRLQAADLDNNGAIDLLLAPVIAASGGAPTLARGKPPLAGPPGATGALVWLGDEKGNFALLEKLVGPALVFDAADATGSGRLDLLGISAGQAVRAVNHGTKNYHWQVVRPRARQATGDQRINSFGIGGEMEIRSGLLTQKQLISSPLVHFGLGDHAGVDVVRVLWPNGTVRAEFELKADTEIVTEQRIKGSCPYLFAFNGKQVEFVKDAVPWSSAIGLRINTLGTARVEATEEWYKISRDELVPHDGFYDLRITAELWETYYYDYLALMVVDHPVGTDIFVDERFVIPPAKLAITTTETPHKIARAVDDNGRDVTAIVNSLDGEYLDTFGRGQYQGVTRDHYVELDLGDDVPTSAPLWLIARGWMHPTDSSVNVAMSQGHHERAQGLSLEVPDGHGRWVVANPNLGFPAGRKKICLIDLTNVFRPGAPHRVRLRTNLEIYWDSFEWAKGITNATLKTVKLDPQVADLHYRGYSVMNQANTSSPELPDYNHLEGTKQRWRDLIGYYTRYGDVRELLAKVDDRYVIMNSGDEMTFRFAAQAPPAAGWVRDYLIVGDGWIKDGDYNSTFGKTVLPLPYHAKKQYDTPPKELEDEVVFRQHPEDWQIWQTRYVSPDVFKNALRK
jgi:Tfp pilus assembly protein PilF